jgi:hypothetical protein
LRQRGNAEAQRGDSWMHQRDIADAPAQQCRQCRGASATTPMHKRNNAEAPARRYRGTSAVMPRRQRGDAEAPSSCRRRSVASPILRLDVADCPCLSGLSSARRVYKSRPARVLAPVEHQDQPRAGNPDHAHDRATRSKAWAMNLSG